MQTTDASGFFTVTTSGLPGGAYNWRVKCPNATPNINVTPGFLANSGVLTLSGAPITRLEVGSMRAGDANNDNIVSIQDFNLLKNTFGKTIGEPGYDARADFTGDRTVNIADFNLLRGNFGISGQL